MPNGDYPPGAQITPYVEPSSPWWHVLTRPLAELVPYQQTWLGERTTVAPGVGRIPIVGGVLSALGALAPGEQQWLGEPAQGYQGLPQEQARQMRSQGIPSMAANIPGVIGAWNTNPQAPEYGQWFFRIQTWQGLRLGTFKRNGVFKTWKPYKPLCLGKRPTPARAAAVAAGLARHVKRFSRVASVLGFKVVRKGSKG